jgi:hypothetical protein
MTAQAKKPCYVRWRFRIARNGRISDACSIRPSALVDADKLGFCHDPTHALESDVIDFGTIQVKGNHQKRCDKDGFNA